MKNDSINVRDLRKSVNGFKRVTSRLIPQVINRCIEEGFAFDSYALKYNIGKKFKLEALKQDDNKTRFELEILDDTGATESIYCYTM